MVQSELLKDDYIQNVFFFKCFSNVLVWDSNDKIIMPKEDIYTLSAAEPPEPH